MSKSSVQRRLEAGEQVVGVFAPADADFETPGILSWSVDEGALLELVSLDDPWPAEFDQRLTIHGIPHSGQEVTLLHASLRTRTMMDRPSRFMASTLVIGAHVTEATRWPRANYRPSTLHEWLPETGLSIEHPQEDLSSVRVEFSSPPGREVETRGGRVGLRTGAEWSWGYTPEWTIRTSLTFNVRPSEPMTVDELVDEFGAPLLAFSEFAADAPDAVTRESYFDPESNVGVVVLRRGRQAPARDWSPLPGHLLFRAEDVEDEAETVGRWLDLWHRVDPALAFFQQHLEFGSSYSAPRFLTLYAAAEGYWKATRTDSKPWNPRALARRADVSPELTGATDEALALIGASRAYHAHVNVGEAFTAEQIETQTFESTRRLHALMQACLLREMGLSTAAIEARLKSHYSNWAVP